MNTLHRTREIAVTPDLVSRFWPMVDKSAGPDGCWPWKGKTQNGGYGVIWFGGQHGTTMYAHRLSFAIANNDPVGFAVCHRCDNPQCVNPAHLFLGTIADNVQDMIAKGRGRLPVPPRGEAAASAKLSEADVIAIRQRSAAGEPSSRLGEAFGIDPSTVRQIVRREIWQHVGSEVLS